MRERPTLTQIGGIMLLAWLASLAIGPLGNVIADPAASPAAHAFVAFAYLASGAVLVLGVLALVGAAWRFRSGLFMAPATRPGRLEESVRGPDEPDTPLSGPDDQEPDGFEEWASDEEMGGPAADWETLSSSDWGDRR